MANEVLVFKIEPGELQALERAVQAIPKAADRAFQRTLVTLRRRLSSRSGELNRSLQTEVGVRPKVFLGKERHSRLRFNRPSRDRGIRIWIGQNPLILNAWVMPAKQRTASRKRDLVTVRGKTYPNSFWGRNPKKKDGYLPFQRKQGSRSLTVLREPIKRETDPIIGRIFDRIPEWYRSEYARLLRVEIANRQ